ncbi:MAG: hypothetical protein Q7S99_17410 [Parvibaculum sp.]|nr:hypothetical protein [Parvibaculum sp.]|tara:strand:+ start:1617 stop:1901 length:285 start_codon:yes stop_codon:yes gene_type:complete
MAYNGTDANNNNTLYFLVGGILVAGLILGGLFFTGNLSSFGGPQTAITSQEGIPGPAGPQGAQGNTGETGKSGATGEWSITGETDNGSTVTLKP